jgi:hypothetical protein
MGEAMGLDKGLEMKYFVLSPESSDERHADASAVAMCAYADAIMLDDPERAMEIRNWAILARAKQAQRRGAISRELLDAVYVENVSKEALEFIRENECEGYCRSGDMARSRFRRFWNEILSLRAALKKAGIER